MQRVYSYIGEDKTIDKYCNLYTAEKQIFHAVEYFIDVYPLGFIYKGLSQNKL